MRENGFSIAELRKIKQTIEEAGGCAELVMVSDALPSGLREANEAATLIVRNGAGLLLGRASAANELRSEQAAVAYDKLFWNARQKKTLNKQARYNVVFGPEAVAHDATYEQPTVHPLRALPLLDGVRSVLPQWLGAKAEGLYAEGNHYYEKKSGIGFHGDAERKVVICLSLGSSATLRYQWRKPNSSAPFREPVDVTVHHGDVYIMSEKATGNDWMSRSKYRVVHGAGARTYIEKGYEKGASASDVSQPEKEKSAKREDLPPEVALDADGNGAVLALKTELERAVSAVQVDSVLRVLKELSEYGCTRRVLECTRVGVSVGKLRKHEDERVSGLAASVVGRWKTQLAVMHATD